MYFYYLGFIWIVKPKMNIGILDSNALVCIIAKIHIDISRRSINRKLVHSCIQLILKVKNWKKRPTIIFPSNILYNFLIFHFIPILLFSSQGVSIMRPSLLWRLFRRNIFNFRLHMNLKNQQSVRMRLNLLDSMRNIMHRKPHSICKKRLLIIISNRHNPWLYNRRPLIINAINDLHL